jgi:hypothetical protein
MTGGIMESETAMDISGYLVSLRTKEDLEVSRVANSNYTTGKTYSLSDWNKARVYATWIMKVRDRALLSDFFNEHYEAEHWWLIPSVTASEILETYNKWLSLTFTELEKEVILWKEEDLMEYLLAFAPDKSIKGQTYWGFRKQETD